MRSPALMLTATALAVALAACGQSEPPPPEPAPPVVTPAPATVPPDPVVTGSELDPLAPEVQTDGGPGTRLDIEAGGLEPHEAAAIASQRADGKASTDDDGTDAQGNVRTHTEAETAAAEETETPEDDDDRHE